MDDIVESLNDLGLKDRSMVWNTDLVEVSFMFIISSKCSCELFPLELPKRLVGKVGGGCCLPMLTCTLGKHQPRQLH